MQPSYGQASSIGKQAEAFMIGLYVAIPNVLHDVFPVSCCRHA